MKMYLLFIKLATLSVFMMIVAIPILLFQWSTDSPDEVPTPSIRSLCESTLPFPEGEVLYIQAEFGGTTIYSKDGHITCPQAFYLWKNEYFSLLQISQSCAVNPSVSCYHIKKLERNYYIKAIVNDRNELNVSSSYKELIKSNLNRCY